MGTQCVKLILVSLSVYGKSLFFSFLSGKLHFYKLGMLKFALAVTEKRPVHID